MKKYLSENSKLVSEFHATKNEDLQPEDFTVGSSKKVWWQCPKEDAHQWDTSIAHRSNGSGCPFCKGIGTSAPEIRVLCELRHLFGSEEAEWRKRIDGVEIDIFLSKYNIGIEYDGAYWHKGKMQSDQEKNEFFEKKGIQIVRIRVHPLKVISKNDIVVANDLNKDDLNALILKINTVFKLPLDINLDAYIKNQSFLNEAEFKRFISYLPSPPPEFSILKTHPEISKQWHFEKNSPLLPENFTSGSNKKVWWQCPKDDEHEWFALINNRSKGVGCPFCSGKKASKANNLLVKNPLLSTEWHPTKNRDLKPENFTVGSSKKVWWQCSKGEDHEWQTTIASRSAGTGCPFCSGQRTSKTNNLLAKHPEVASEWHPTKNGDLKPEDFTVGSSKKVWWQCPKEDAHEWETRINHRSNGGGCPFCSGQRVSKTNNLLAKHPEVASEWHPTKNGDLKPENVSYGAEKTVWWQCAKDNEHEWEKKVHRRTRGSACPFCSMQKKNK
mgnify:CR=1 FL=1